jgi:hypothetical protein
MNGKPWDLVGLGILLRRVSSNHIWRREFLEPLTHISFLSTIKSSKVQGIALPPKKKKAVLKGSDL